MQAGGPGDPAQQQIEQQARAQQQIEPQPLPQAHIQPQGMQRNQPRGSLPPGGLQPAGYAEPGRQCWYVQRHNRIAQARGQGVQPAAPPPLNHNNVTMSHDLQQQL